MGYSRGPYQTRTSFGGFGPVTGGPPPRDVVVLLVVVFVTYAMQFFASTAIVPAFLHLSPAAWRLGFVWQVATYAFAGYGPASLWFLLELFILYWFGTDVYVRLGRRRFWRTVLLGVVAAGVAAVALHLLASVLLGGSPTPAPFMLMQGQRTLWVILIAAFATLYADATILLFFVLPMRARWFLWLGILIGLVGFLSSHDIGGFGGICAATGVTYLDLVGGGPRRDLRRRWLRWKEAMLRRRLDRMRRKRGIHVVRDDERRDPPRWVN
jgi:membrane associated rhomboid family serine protease